MLSKSWARLVCCLVMLSSGCEQNASPERVAVATVSGSVFVNQKPATGAKVMLHPMTPQAGETKLFPTGIVNESGTFALTTYMQDDGAPRGEYQVTVTWPDTEYQPRTPIEKEEMMMGGDRPDKLRGRYATPTTSGLRATITGEPGQQLERIDLR